MAFLDTDETTLHLEAFGDGAPVTLFVHGVASSIADVRFLGSGVGGTRVFMDLRGHGGSGSPEGTDAWGYPAVARDVRAVADHVGARAAVGVSLGAGAILRCVADTPDRFDRIALVLPASLDQPRPADPASNLAAMARLIDGGDVAGLTALLSAQLPEDIASRRGVDRLMAGRAAAMCRPGVPRAIRALPDHTAVADRAALARYAGRALVIAHEGDDTHPAAVARDVAAALPGAQLHVFDRPWSMLRERAALRHLLSGFLNG